MFVMYGRDAELSIKWRTQPTASEGERGAAPSWRGLTAGAGPREPGGQSGKKGARKESFSRRGKGWETN